MRKAGLVVLASLLAGCGGASAPVQTTTPPPTLAITSSALPAGGTGASYAGNGFSLTASGGRAPYSWTWDAAQGSSLPGGLSLSTSGLISGTPEVASTYNVIVTVVDSSTPAAQASANYVIAITGTPGFAIMSAAPPDGTVGTDYGPTVTETFKCTASPVLGWHFVCTPCSSTVSCSSLPPCRGFFPSPCRQTRQVFMGFTFTAAGGVPPYTWSASGMPPGIDVDPPSGEILGTPTTAGSYSVMVTVTDASSLPAQTSATYVMDIGSSSGGMCVARGGQCYTNHPCCAGLQCVPASTRAFCQ